MPDCRVPAPHHAGLVLAVALVACSNTGPAVVITNERDFVTVVR